MKWRAEDVVPGVKFDIQPSKQDRDKGLLENGKNMHDDLVITFYRQNDVEKFGVVMTHTGFAMFVGETDRQRIADWLTNNCAVPHDVILPKYLTVDEPR